MVNHLQAKELLQSLVNRGESLDTRDLTLFFGWIYSSYVSLEPFPVEHRKFCERCLDSFDSPNIRHQAGLALLKSALAKAERGRPIPDSTVSKDYLNLVNRFFQFCRKPNE
ncbi:MAG: hypothetical protein HY912_14355 [Desulfomonile tiedjei]|uniref:Uncharacterized protein n=1 Tax=Desulfomonile tiedjei TaxID=2358 RepID=A0A9D6V359_9BACT|nr:hypothetical protein [Desulfomonile tiedjei]